MKDESRKQLPSEEEYLRVDQGLPIRFRSRSRSRSPRLQREFSYDSGYSSSCLEHASETSHSPRDSRYERRGSFSRQLGPGHRVLRSRPVSPQPSTESYPSDSMATADCSSQGSNIHVSGHDSSCFHYRELRAKEIRLLQLEPTTTTMIKYKPLFYTTIDNAPPYVAISYAWGDVQNQKGVPIQVGAHPLMITESLHGALRALKALVHQAEVSVWADSVCINQQDPDERSRQVQLMPLIYGQAESVFVWLGPEGEDSHLAMQLIEHIARNQDCLERLKAKLRSPNWGKDFSALVCLFERDYWQRLWVAQEVFNARRVTVLCSKSLPWEMFRAVGAVFKKYKTELWPFFLGSWGGHDRSLISKNRVPYFHVLTHDGPSSFPDKADIEMLRRPGDRTFLDVLCAGRQKLTVDPRDKVYAILGLLPREIRDGFIPNYKVSIADVYINVFDYLLTTTGRLDVICEAIHYPLHLSTLKLPTWVPDWSYIPHCEHLPRKGIYRYRADRGKSAVFRFLNEQGYAIEHSGPVIEIQGQSWTRSGVKASLSTCCTASTTISWRFCTGARCCATTAATTRILSWSERSSAGRCVSVASLASTIGSTARPGGRTSSTTPSPLWSGTACRTWPWMRSFSATQMPGRICAWRTGKRSWMRLAISRWPDALSA